MKKKLDESVVLNELETGSAFFKDIKKSAADDGRISDVYSPTLQPKKQERKKVTTIPRYHDTTVSQPQEDVIETIRKAVKQLGKEAATYRFTEDEKRALADIVYQYKGQGIRTSENEITRTAINFLVEDYQRNGKNSVLAQVIERLNA